MASAQQFGKYSLIERIAVGGMAEIYRAVTFGAADFQKDLVIKRILPQFSADDDFVHMFIDEARIAAKLQHPNIVQIFDFDCAAMSDGDSYYIAMELVEGKDLRHLLKESVRKNLPLALSHAVHVAVEALKGLHYAHTKTDGQRPLNIVHRDMSPHNILVSYTGDVKISDFGIAKAAARASVTSNGMVKGKLAYMSPEQVTGQGLDRRTDVFSMGICLYEMLTRTRLFVGETEAETIARVRDAVVPPIRGRNPQVPPDLEQVVMKMLTHEVETRFQSAAEAAKALSTTSVYTPSEAAGLGEYVATLFPPPVRQAAINPNASTGPSQQPRKTQHGNPPAPQQLATMMADAPSPDVVAAAKAKNAPAPLATAPAARAGDNGHAVAPLPSVPAARPIAELKTAILDGNSPDMVKVQAQIAAAQAQKKEPAPAPVSELKTAILDGNSPDMVKVQAQIAAAQAAQSAKKNPGADPHSPTFLPDPLADQTIPPQSAPPLGGGPIQDQKTAILDGNSPDMAKVQAQIAAAQASRGAPPPAAGPPPMMAPPPAAAPPPPSMGATMTPPMPQGGGQRTVMLDSNAPPASALAPRKPTAPVAAASMKPLPPVVHKAPPPTWPRWVIGPIVMMATAAATAGASNYFLSPKDTVRLVQPKKVEIKIAKIALATTPSRASVTLDGKQWPKFTPTTIEAELGKTVHVVCSLDGYKSAEADVVFSEDPRPLTLTLDREDPDVVTAKTAEKKDTSSSKSDSGHHSSHSSGAKGTGVVAIFVRPFAVVFVDGKRIRQTPIANLQIPAGKHTIELVNDAKGKHEKITVNIKSGENPEIRRDWDK